MSGATALSPRHEQFPLPPVIRCLRWALSKPPDFRIIRPPRELFHCYLNSSVDPKRCPGKRLVMLMQFTLWNDSPQRKCGSGGFSQKAPTSVAGLLENNINAILWRYVIRPEPLNSSCAIHAFAIFMLVIKWDVFQGREVIGFLFKWSPGRNEKRTFCFSHWAYFWYAQPGPQMI